MRKVWLFVFSFLPLFAQNAYEQIQKLLPDAKILEIKDIERIYGVKISLEGRLQNLYVFKDFKNYILGGQLYRNGKPVHIPLNMQQFRRDCAFETNSSAPKERVFYIFTDPECPYCKRLHHELKAAPQGVSFCYFLYPLPFHKKAKPMVLKILSAPKKKRKELFNTLMEGAPIDGNVSSKAKDLLMRQMEIADFLGVRGTPTIFDAQGKELNNKELFDRLSISPSVERRAFEYLDDVDATFEISKGKGSYYLFADPYRDRDYIQKFLSSDKRIKLVMLPKTKEGFATAIMIQKSANRFKSLQKYLKNIIGEEEMKRAPEWIKSDQNLSKRVLAPVFIGERAGVKPPALYDGNGRSVRE